jgi:hypothetical protein
MTETPTIEGDIVHELPDELNAVIGQVIVAYARLEFNITALAGLMLQLNKAEARIALRTPRVTERLDIVLDLFAIKAIIPSVDTVALRTMLEQAANGRDAIAHGIWLRHPETGELWLRHVRGNWPKDKTGGDRVKRSMLPQSIPYGPEQCKATLALIEEAFQRTNDLGAQVDRTQIAFPERFRGPAPNLNPLGRRRPKESQARRVSLPGKPREEEKP